jgi:hypothetical protein
MQSFYGALPVALHGLRRHRMRSVLTSLGIIIGVAAVIAMMELGEGTSQAVQQTIVRMGANQLLVEAGPMSMAGVSVGAGTTLTLTPDDCEAILRECNAVRWAAPGVDCRLQVLAGNRNWAPWKILAAAEVSGADGYAGQAEGEGGVGEGGQPSGGLSNPLQDGRAGTVVVQAQARAQGGKSPGGSRDSGRPARPEAGFGRHERSTVGSRCGRDRDSHSRDRPTQQGEPVPAVA